VEKLRHPQGHPAAVAAAVSEDLAAAMAAPPDRRFSTTPGKLLPVTVDRERARFSAWYELFPRSCSPEPGRHGTFRDVEAWLPRIAEMGFDVVYLPPIHPIGRTHRKGRNNARLAAPDDLGSPWAIGAEEGGHKSIHPQLGTLDDFRRLIQQANDLGMEIALTSPSMPRRTILREGPPRVVRKRPTARSSMRESAKKYKHLPLRLRCDAWRELWEELKSVLETGSSRGFACSGRQPHTPRRLPFWQWAIGAVKRDYPETIFLSEAFTRPKVMRYLAKIVSASRTPILPAEHEVGVDGVRPRADAHRDARVLPAELLAEHARHPAGILQFGGRPAQMARLFWRRHCRPARDLRPAV
jgi:starch synthase (maltosyl-transferring)